VRRGSSDCWGACEYIQIVGGLPVIFRNTFVGVEHLQIVGVRVIGACVQSIFRLLGGSREYSEVPLCV